MPALGACAPALPEGVGFEALRAEQERRAVLRGTATPPHVAVRNSAQTIGTAPVITRPARDTDEDETAPEQPAG